ncbi:MAG: DUF354 domain-containing protein [Fibrobacter sp.]|nr:DUF354 domain-containing protein [Fibrobacter sp.]
MKIGIFAITPAQIHFYKNIVNGLREAGHETFLLIRDYGESLQLAEELGIEHYVFSDPPDSKLGKVANFPLEILRSTSYLRSKGVDVVTGFGIYEAYTSAVLRCPAITFTDSEYNCNRLSFLVQFWLSEKFMDHIVTPEKYSQDLGEKQVRVNSYKELAYLHPNYYQPDPRVLDELGVEPGEPYVILRFNAFDAVHDVGISGFDDKQRELLVDALKDHARVFISAEGKLNDSLKEYLIPTKKCRIHDALAFATLLVTDTQTMATESALLGTPTIRVNSFVGSNDMSNFVELEQDYGLLYNFKNPLEAIEQAEKLISDPSLKNDWQKKRDVLLSDKDDIVEYFTHFLIENTFTQYSRQQAMVVHSLGILKK